MNPRALAAARLAALLLVALPCSLRAQELVVNGGFDGGLAAWRITGDGTATYASDDITGGPGSGSARLANASADAAIQVVPLDQCIPMLPPGTYAVSASARVDPAQVPGRAVFGVTLYGGMACDGAIRGGGGRDFARSTAFVSSTFEFTAADGGSFLLRLGVDKTNAGGVLEATFDAVSVVQTPLLFRSGFE